MAKTIRKFTEEERAELKKNPFTLAVTEERIFYTETFKSVCWDLLRAGRTPRRAFTELGYNPEVLGSKRMERTAHRLRKAHGVSISTSPVGRASDYSKLPADAVLASMERELKYLRQENEFLKKLSAQGKAGKPGR